ncbi:hypothetical protein CRV08_08545 [Halarcobacter ebronensis]|uniref:SPOR domain-containing protein n=1 Tax=Halarcobacter ebronensis TaxID=1462615 RepID=A0A4Q0YCX9_9BACT|nr:TolC family protein [Halarcobacter ebronensis]RXJ68290.1 hypothetical protein CRV08_08545 [Halarcobacter ebronensis]
MKKVILISTIFLLNLTNASAFSLKDGYLLAIENDMDSKVNENNLKNIEYDIDIANSLLYPTLDFTANAKTTKRTEDHKTPGDGTSSKSDEYKFEVTQPVFDGFESKYEKQLQKKTYDSAVYYLKESQNNLAQNYVQSYINVLRDKDLLSATNEGVTISEDIFKKVYKKIELGYGTKLEFDQVKGNLAESRVNVDTQRINLKESLEGLKYYIQKDFDSSELIKPSFYTKLPESLDEAVTTALRENPTVNVAKANLDVAIAEEKKANKEFYPTVNFVGTYNLDNSQHAEDDQEYNEYSLGFELSYNLYNGGRDTAAVKKALQNIKEKKYLITKSEYQIKNSVRLAWNSYKLNREKNRSLKQYIVVKKDIFDSMLKEFDLGLKDLNTLLEEYIEYIDVKKDLISNSYDLLYAKYNLLASIGKLPDSLMDKLPTLKTGEEYDSETLDILKNPSYNYDDDSQLDSNKYKIIKPQVKNVDMKEEKVPQIEKSSFSQELTQSDFKDRFLKASKDKYTINLALAYSQTNAQGFLDRYDLNSNAFYFSFGKENKYIKIMMGIYDSEKEAQEALNNLNASLKSNMPKIEKISIKQKLYSKYHGNNLPKEDKEFFAKSREAQIKRVSFSKDETEEKRENISFKQRFLLASNGKYTINLALSNSQKGAQNFIDKYNISNSAFFFSFGYENPLQKIMMGIYENENEAQKALDNLPSELKRNQPRVERVSIKQKLYKKYHPEDYNNSIQAGSI